MKVQTAIGIGAAAVGIGAAAWWGTHRDPGAPTQVDVPKTTLPPTPPVPPEPRVNTDAAGFEAAVAARFDGAAPPIHEWSMPPGGARPAGVAIIIHGGGWFGVGAERVRTMDAEVARWNARGWATVNIDYRPGGDSMVDVQRMYDAVRTWQGEDVPIGAVGASAGGHLAMMLAIQRPQLAFAESEAGPTDIPAIAGNGFADVVRDAGIRAFGDEAGAGMSPLARAAELAPPLLMATAANDAFVPIEQMQRMAAARPATTALTLQPGDAPWIHGPIDAASMAQLVQAEDALAAAAAIAPG